MELSPNIVKKLLSPEVKQFIKDHAMYDPFSLSLKYKDIAGIPIKFIANQIATKQKAKNKLPQWFENEKIIFPSLLALEQCSSQKTAIYKSGIVQGGDTMTDLTGGMGVDTYYMGKQFKKTIYVEKNKTLADMAAHNFNALGSDIMVKNESTESFIKDITFQDLIYLDPDRRSKQAQKVVRFEDCEPDVTQLMPVLLKKAKQILVKTSPMLDIDLAIKTLAYVKEARVVSVNNECKEVLYLLTAEKNPDPTIHAVNLTGLGEQSLVFKYSKERTSKIMLSLPLTYIYEPNASIMKAGCFNILTEKLDIKKISTNTHLYTSNELIKEFPGRIFVINQLLPYDKKKMIRAIPGKKANITTRNFPENVKAIRKKTGIKEGGDTYIFAFTDLEGIKKIAVTDKIKSMGLNTNDT